MCHHQPSAPVTGRPLKFYNLHELDEMERDIAAAHRLNDSRDEDTLASGPMALAFAKVPAVGTEVMWRGQPYTLVEVKPYARKDGAPSQLLVWEAPCWTCNAPFRLTVALGGAKGVNRRCAAHRRPGSRVSRERLSA